jgi:predicted alpha/beta-hydrolase family hydrolase
MSVSAFLLAPGAGASSSSPWMQAVRERLETLGTVQTLDYPYRLQGRSRPDALPVLVDAHRRALTTLRAVHGANVVLAGKSMGSRIGCHVALEERVRGLICLGYPLRGAGKKAPLRDAVLLALETPILFVQGTRDPLCPLDELADVMARMSAPRRLHVVSGGDHSLLVTKTELRRLSRTQADVDAEVLHAIAEFVRSLEPATP